MSLAARRNARRDERPPVIQAIDGKFHATQLTVFRDRFSEQFGLVPV